MTTPPNPIPLAVDLDGSLLRTDSLIESLFVLIKSRPLLLPMLFIWLLKGRACLKDQVARRAKLDVSGLPYNLDVLNYLHEQHHDGRKLMLVTGADRRTGDQISEYFHFFDQVMASDGTTNLSGEQKRDRLVREFGVKGFDYIGNSEKDIPVWEAARHSVVVGRGSFIAEMEKRLSNVVSVFTVDGAGWREWNHALRLYQWLKNVLLFVPLLAAHRFNEIGLIFPVLLAFLSFGLCASSVYILNDLLDLPEDRRHPRKRFRPFASGTIPLLAGIVAAPLLLVCSLLVSFLLPGQFLAMLALYYVITLGYSLRLKNVVILDIIILASLFTLRMMAGAAAVDIWPSSWLLAHSMFLFISLALVKRYAELVTMRLAHGQAAKARSYEVNDSELLAAMGVASAFVSALVLALYITSGSAALLYGRQQLIWLACPVLLYWLCYIWLIAHRGGMHDDPLVFALKDRISQIVIGLTAVILLLAI